MNIIEKVTRNRFLLLGDICIVYFSYLLTLLIGFRPSAAAWFFKGALIYMFAVAMIYVLIFAAAGMYRIMWAYGGTRDYIKLIAVSALSGLVSVVLVKLVLSGGYTSVVTDGGKRIKDVAIWRIPYFFGKRPIGYTDRVEYIAHTVMIILCLGMRMFVRLLDRFARMYMYRSTAESKRVIIYGAGSTAMMLMREFAQDKGLDYSIVGFIDDDETKKNMAFGGVKVLGSMQDVKKICRRYQADMIVLAMPRISVQRRKEIVQLCTQTGCTVKILPDFNKILVSGSAIGTMRNVEIEDLLAREPVKLDNHGIRKFVTGKTVLVTGGGGSIGSELCRQLMNFDPGLLLILDIYENNAYDLQNELKHNFPYAKFEVLIASVRDKERLDDIFRTYRPNIVFHAAAHKHVPLMEDSPGEAVKNNVFGTYNVAKCANEFGAEKFVMISTDKAVNPTNIMGATKRMCEKIVQSMQSVSKTEYVAVRFGNVLGSNGSVIPLFKKQIQNGGPVTVTHKDITRFFMTIPEAAQLVIQAASTANGGEIFVLDMGEPVKIYDLAVNLIKLAGFIPDVDIKIEVTGLRPGEKLYEELLMDEEGLQKTGHEKIFIGQPIFSDMAELERELDILRTAIDTEDNDKIKYAVAEVVPTYHMNADEYNSKKELVSVE